MAKKKTAKKKTAVIKKEPVVCPRCNGDGFWHSPKTGYRAKTASELLVDETRKCPKCDGIGKL